MLFKNDSVGAVDVVIDPTNPRVVYAALWNTRRPPWYTYQPTNGPGGGIFKSTDGGTTWKQLTNGLPTACIGKTGIADRAEQSAARLRGRRRLPSGGRAGRHAVPWHASWTRRGAGAAGAAGAGRGRGAGAAAAPLRAAAGRLLPIGRCRRDVDEAVERHRALWGRGWYFEKVAVDPKNADIVYVPNVSLSRSKDGGKTWVPLRGSPGGDDYQQPWISPDDSEHDDRARAIRARSSRATRRPTIRAT